MKSTQQPGAKPKYAIGPFNTANGQVFGLRQEGCQRHETYNELSSRRDANDKLQSYDQTI
jgi:hypothetical protein